MKKLSLYKNNHHQSKGKLHEDNERLSSILTVREMLSIDPNKPICEVATNVKKQFLVLETKK